MAEPARIERRCAAPGCRAPRDRGLSLRLLVLLPLLAAALKTFGFRRTYAALGRTSASRVRPARHDAPAEAADRRASGTRSPRHIADVLVHVNRHVLPYQSRCLLESLTLWYLLRRNGHPADLLLGARTLLGPFEAHAWVELDGEVLNDSDNVRDVYQPFDLPAIGARPGSP